MSDFFAALDPLIGKALLIPDALRNVSREPCLEALDLSEDGVARYIQHAPRQELSLCLNEAQLNERFTCAYRGDALRKGALYTMIFGTQTSPLPPEITTRRTLAQDMGKYLITAAITTLTVFWDAQSGKLSFSFDYAVEYSRLDLAHGMHIDENYQDLDLFQLLDQTAAQRVGGQLALQVYPDATRLPLAQQADYHWEHVDALGTVTVLIGSALSKLNYLEHHRQLYRLTHSTETTPTASMRLLVRPRINEVYYLRETQPPMEAALEMTREFVDLRAQYPQEYKPPPNSGCASRSRETLFFKDTRTKALMRTLPSSQGFLDKPVVKERWPVPYRGKNAGRIGRARWFVYNEAMTFAALRKKQERFSEAVLRPQPTLISYRETDPGLSNLLVQLTVQRVPRDPLYDLGQLRSKWAKKWAALGWDSIKDDGLIYTASFDVWQMLADLVKNDTLRMYLQVKYFGWSARVPFDPQSMFFENTTYSYAWDSETDGREVPLLFEYQGRVPLQRGRRERIAEQQVTAQELERAYGLVPRETYRGTLRPSADPVRFEYPLYEQTRGKYHTGQHLFIKIMDDYLSHTTFLQLQSNYDGVNDRFKVTAGPLSWLIPSGGALRAHLFFAMPLDGEVTRGVYRLESLGEHAIQLTDRIPVERLSNKRIILDTTPYFSKRAATSIFNLARPHWWAQAAGRDPDVVILPGFSVFVDGDYAVRRGAERITLEVRSRVVDAMTGQEFDGNKRRAPDEFRQRDALGEEWRHSFSENLVGLRAYDILGQVPPFLVAQFNLGWKTITDKPTSLARVWHGQHLQVGSFRSGTEQESLQVHGKLMELMGRLADGASRDIRIVMDLQRQFNALQKYPVGVALPSEAVELEFLEKLGG